MSDTPRVDAELDASVKQHKTPEEKYLGIIKIAKNLEREYRSKYAIANKLAKEFGEIAKSLHQRELRIAELEAENAKLKADAARKEGDWR